MKIKLLLTVCFAVNFTYSSQAQITYYKSITNMSRHVTNYHPTRLSLKLWPNISTNTTDFYFPSETPFHNDKFSINISNSVIVLGATNILQCRLDNQSTNAIAYWSLTFVYVTNNTSFYQLLPKVEPPNTNAGPENTFNPGVGVSFIGIEAGKTREWDLPLIINKRVQEGKYELRASQGVVTRDAKYSWELQANSLEVNVVK